MSSFPPPSITSSLSPSPFSPPPPSSYPSSSSLLLTPSLLMPRKGLGTFQCPETSTIVYEALKIGYKLIDTARLYGNEVEVGKGVNKWLAEGGDRSQIWITTKVYNEWQANMVEEVKKSLADLGLEYIDLVLLHWPFGRLQEDMKTIKQRPLHIVWAELEECVQLGLTKAIGVSNFNCQLLCDLMSYCKVRPALNQIEIHPFLSQVELVKFCQKYDIQVTGYAPLCRGGLSPKKKFGDSIDLLNHLTILKLSEKYKRTPAQIALNWSYWRNIGVIPKTEKLSRLRENFEYDEFQMDMEDLEVINGMNIGLRTINPKDPNTSFKGTPLFD